MNRNARIFVAGHRGLAGSAIVRALRANGYRNLLLRTREELDLTDKHETAFFFDTASPEYVFLAAARVGGIYANSTYPADFIRDNLSIQTNVIHYAAMSGVKRLLFLGSTCVYPRDCPQPMREEHLMTGPLEKTNSAYALAKIAGIEMCRAYNHQHNTAFAAVMPTNLYGPGDNYHPANSHVLPALIRRFHEAVVNGRDTVELWGSGRAVRDFLHVDDMASACVHLMRLPDRTHVEEADKLYWPILNVGSGVGVSIRDLATMIAEETWYRGRIVFDNTKPDGTPIKLTDSSRMKSLGWNPVVSLKDGLSRTYASFLQEMEQGTLRSV